MSRPRMAELHTVAAVERELDTALVTLRQLDRAQYPNLPARAATEYRIGALRRRREALYGMANPRD